MCRRCNCKYNHNNSSHQMYEFNKNLIENKSCNNMPTSPDYYDDDCDCGFDDDSNIFPENPMYGQSYVPIQNLNKTFTPCAGLKMGTIFPELVSPYYPGLSIEQINYLRKNNDIKEGCNSCPNQM